MVKSDELKKLRALEARLGYHFQNISLLQTALTHSSKANDRRLSNERMEFLGDAILGLIVCELLYQRFPDWDEGQLTRVKSAIVSRTTCGRIGERFDIEPALMVGRGVHVNVRVPRSLLSNAVESLIGAIFLDSGIESVKQVLLEQIEIELNEIVASEIDDNYKSQLQQIVQKRFGESPIYRLLAERGPDHKKSFLVSASFQGRDFAPAWGSTKKAAEQQAAANAIDQLTSESILD
ncbi:MAG TPA: ribonuclease III [Pirellulaceae bacterium]|nr:ribonuclease III [Pirellulaceae bacterium]HMO90959.1 ribonuclease III [Pirellulaceae bacterium]HMP69857.1 ribonuclease III [Pirellulaceae bacterium]